MTAHLDGHVHFDGTDLERDYEVFMRFRLTYEGPLLSSQPAQLTDKNGNPAKDRKGEHKHRIRQQLHPQLKRLWSANQFLRFNKLTPASSWDILPESAMSVQWDDQQRKRPMSELLSQVFSHHKDLGYGYVPLIWEDADLACSLRILCLRLDHDNAVLPGRDIDNRIKTLIDALMMPSVKQGPPMRDNEELPAQEDEKPFFVLLDDDRRIAHLEIETDHLLAPVPSDADESYVRLLITVETRVVNTTMFNLSFA